MISVSQDHLLAGYDSVDALDYVREVATGLMAAIDLTSDENSKRSRYFSLSLVALVVTALGLLVLGLTGGLA